MNNQRLSGQVAWITGAGQGIGKGIALRFAKEGAKVAVVEYNEKAGKEVADEINDSGGKAIFIQCDVSKEAEVKYSLEQTVKNFGRLHILVNNAGMVHIKQLHEYEESEWDYLMGVNLKSIFFSIKHSIQYLRKNKNSYVVNLASVSSFVGQANTPAYIASKGAVLQLTKAIALDYAVDKIRCNCICPGITITPLLNEHLESTGDAKEALAKRLKRVPLGIGLSPDDIAKCAVYLSCEDSSGITGTSILVDGGYLAAAEWE